MVTMIGACTRELTACSSLSLSLSFARSLATRRDSKLDRLISRSGKPFDLLTFYAEVCRRGGFGRDRHDAKTRFSITKVFKVMFNCFKGTPTRISGISSSTCTSSFFLRTKKRTQRRTCRSTRNIKMVCRKCKISRISFIT